MHHFGLRHKRMRKEGTIFTVPESGYTRTLDKVTLVAGVVGPLTVLPQIYQIFSTHQAAGVSSIAWALMFIVTLPWVFYGIAHRDKSIIASFILWEIMNIIVVIGAVMYR